MIQFFSNMSTNMVECPNMGKIYFLMGKSASGKDTLYQKLLENKKLNLIPYVGYTTRPIRDGEKEGVEYFFTTKKDLDNFQKAGKLIEYRVYHTVYGDWYYYSVDSDRVNLEENDYLYIGTLESYVKMRDYYGSEKIIPIYIEVDDGLRLERALSRERTQKNPGYAEMCRRFLGDSEDFSEENLKKAGIEKRFDNTNLEECINCILKEVFAV